MSYISEIQDTIPRVLNTLGKIYSKESESFSTELDQSRIEETHATQFDIPTNPVYFAKEVVPIGKRMWNQILAYKSFKGDEFFKLVTRLVRRYDQDEREAGGALHWNSMVLKLRKAFQQCGGRTFSDTDWLQHIDEGSNEVRFQHCMNSKNSLLDIRAI